MQEITGQEDRLQFPFEFINWEKKSSMPESYDVFRASPVIVDGKIYFVMRDIVLEYSPDADTWAVNHKHEDLTLWRGIVSLRGKLALVCGAGKWMMSHIDIVERVTVTDENNDGWQYSHPYPRVPLGRSNPACVSHQHYLIVAGGGEMVGSLDRVDVLDTDSKQWFVAPPLPYVGSNVQTVIMGETLYALFQGNNIIIRSRSLYRVSIPTLISYALQGKNRKSHSSTIWEKLPDVPYYQSALFSIGNMLLTAGGVCGGVLTEAMELLSPHRNSRLRADIFLLNPHSYKWVKVGELPESRCSCSCTMLPESGKLLVVGGEIAGEQHPSNSVYTASISSPLMQLART